MSFQESIRQSLSLVSVMYWSRLSDHIGRKPILLLGTLALAISLLSFGSSTTFLGLIVRYLSAFCHILKPVQALFWQPMHFHCF